MTISAQRVLETPMAPYLELLENMTKEEKQIVVSFLSESMVERKPYKVKPVSSGVKKWCGCATFTEDEINSDPRIKSILSR